LAIKLLAPGGTLLTFSCSGAMSPDLFQKVRRPVPRSMPGARCGSWAAWPTSDHPVPLSFPEAEYLKGLVLQAE